MPEKIIYTYTDEAPMLATYSLLPIIQCFAKGCGVAVETRDISVAGRVLAQFPECLTEEQKCGDYLTELGDLCKTPAANVIKLPNISASIPQLEACITELNEKGYKIPPYPANPKNPEEEAIKAKYSKSLGSSVNPVLREGNSDRRAATAVKQYAQMYPHKMGAWSTDCKSHVSHMTEGDFYGSEKSVVVPADCSVRIEMVNGSDVTVLKDNIKLLQKELIDCSRMSVSHIRQYYKEQIQEAKDQNILLSLHLKATMMKISDPILFGHMVEVYYANVWEKYGDLFNELKITSRNGLGDVYAKMKGHAKEQEVIDAIESNYLVNGGSQPDLAMVDSDRGITNLHCPSDVIIDASMPVVVRDSGGMWCPDSAKGARDSKLKDVKCCIPDRSYAGIYKASLDFCRENGQFDVKTMGSVPNVGLMAIKAEEYGSHDKTFEVSHDNVTIRVVNTSDNSVLMEQTDLKKGDVFRMCQTKDISIKDWVKLAVSRSKLSGWPVVFWLDPERAHDRNMIEKVDEYLKLHDTTGLDIQKMDPVTAIKHSMTRAKNQENTISATGNVLRDYLTDLFPILELGTSAKMLSIVPLLAGGAMFETGAGGSAPKHVQQFTKENHLRWDSLGEFLALAESFQMLGNSGNNPNAAILANGLNAANAKFLVNKECQVSRSKKELDNRGSHFFLALYWAEALSQQTGNKDLKDLFLEMHTEMMGSKDKIVEELCTCQGNTTDLGGYYKVNEEMTEKAMRPCKTWNEMLDKYGVKASDLCKRNSAAEGTAPEANGASKPSAANVSVEGAEKSKNSKCALFGCATGGKSTKA